MHPTMIELLEQLPQGLLWVGSDGVVRHANRAAVRTVGLLAGRRLEHHELARAVVATAVDGRERQVRLPLATSVSGVSLAEVDCRVLPGLDGDDAFVLLGSADQPDGTEGLDTLMRAIGRELHDPLRAAHAALDLAGAADGSTDALELQLLFDRVDDVLRVADRLADLATLWHGGSLAADDRIELWPLLQRAWGDVEPLALDRAVKVRFHALGGTENLATLYGSEHWLRRVFSECLEAAVRATQRGSLLEIEHRQMGPRALIVFRDCGVFAARNPAAAGVPMKAHERGADAAPKDAVPGAREQIGLKLCQHIVSLHGGHLREEHDDGQRNFLIDLPTGAPHQDANPQMDMAQAQRYASDLAALMTRARQRRPGSAPSTELLRSAP